VDARCAAHDIDALVISTCTGYLCPGLTSYVAERLGLRLDVLALDLVGQGCGAALRNWRAAEGLLAGGGARRVLSVCVEVCSAATYCDDDPGVLISTCLFGDGAGAAVLSREAVAEILDQALTRASVSRGRIRGWMMHAGGRDVLNALRLKRGLASAATALSRRSSEPL